jgi:hypothetical protein
MTTSTEICYLLNDVMDDVILRKKFNFNFYRYLETENISRNEIEVFNHSRFINVIKFQIEEFEDFLKGGNSFLREAYPDFNKPDVRKMKDYLEELIESAIKYEQFKRKRKPYKKRKVSNK